ncbi:peptidoglycan DD-metalloendopeptidase family protein [Bacillus sp. RD4P76]|uniref:Peptidoglycan DD-metalloendopeptidase family protein n=2 Tax=Bacillus suaedaesalsae TaxID=2810349 RepID=A0ABS2DEM6_9BACI|nr:M23 family metallopeptidase [Bacillus suaedaesalsae]MBM6616911.1 peptidoglycan DD-metalloendopeptidase family protein [Bacillus suaedaesalsae]
MRFMKRTAIGAAVVSSLAIGTVSAESGINTVYHVYVNGERLGTIDSKKVVEDYIEKRQNQLLAAQPDITVSLDDNVVYISEKVFRPVVDNKEVLNKLSENLEIVAEAYSIIINDEAIAYVDKKEKAEDVLRQMKLKYVSEEVLTEIEQRDPEATLPPLEEGQSRILDVTFTEKVSINKEHVTPDRLFTVEDAVTYLSKGTLEEKKYQVQNGDVLGSIAEKHGLALQDLLSINPGMTDESTIKPGDELNVTALTSYLHVAIQEEVYKRESITFSREIVENKEMNKGDKKIKQKGENGEKLVNSLITKVNGQVSNQEIVSSEVVKQPVNEIVEKGTKVIPSRGSGVLGWPAVGGYVSSEMGQRWGRMHKGIDIARPSNRSILAADNGTVVSASYDGGYGNRIVINHNNGLKTTYSHLASMSVSVGQTVTKGQSIGIMGRTGSSTGVHLHFEVYHNGNLVNPRNYLR